MHIPELSLVQSQSCIFINFPSLPPHAHCRLPTIFSKSRHKLHHFPSAVASGRPMTRALPARPSDVPRPVLRPSAGSRPKIRPLFQKTKMLTKLKLAKSTAKPATGQSEENGSKPGGPAKPQAKAPLSLGAKKLSLGGGGQPASNSQEARPRLSLGSKKLSLNLTKNTGGDAKPSDSSATPKPGVSKQLSLRDVRKVSKTPTDPTRKGGTGGPNLRELLGANAMGSRAKHSMALNKPKEEQGGTGGVRACRTGSGTASSQPLEELAPKRRSHARRNTAPSSEDSAGGQVRKIKTSVARKDDIRALEEKLKAIENDYKEQVGHNKILSRRIDEMLDRMVTVREWTKNVEECVNQMSMGGYPAGQVSFMKRWILSIKDLLNVQGSCEQNEWKIVRETLGVDAKVLDGAFRTLVQQQTEIYKKYNDSHRGVPWYQERPQESVSQPADRPAPKRSRSLDPRWFK